MIAPFVLLRRMVDAGLLCASTGHIARTLGLWKARACVLSRLRTLEARGLLSAVDGVVWTVTERGLAALADRATR